MGSTVLETPRLFLEPITLEIVLAVMTGDKAKVEAVVRAEVPAAWPGRALVERAFSADVEQIQKEPEARLWGDRLMLTKDAPRRIAGSVIFHGAPKDGVAEVGYGVEESMQGQGVATEATSACVTWALSQASCRLVRATTPPWHVASIRVLEKSGFVRVGLEEHESLGEIAVYERDRDSPGPR